MGEKRKNLVFVFADQWRADAMGCVHADPVITPNMDALCADATYCDHAFSTFPVCSPHRASLLTGRYPLSIGFYTNCKIGLPLRLGDDVQGAGQMLAAAGYHTAYIGKWHLDEPEQNHSASPASGARGWDAYTPPGVQRHGFEEWYAYNTYDMHLTPHYWRDTPQMVQPRVWGPQHETDVAIAYLHRAKQRTRPFALYLAWNPPHSPYDQVPQRYLDLYPDIELKQNASADGLHHHTGEQMDYTPDQLKLATRQYYAAVSGLDEQLGRLIAALKAEGLYEDTVLVLSADHGDMMGSHGLMGKHVWYEESIRIPFVVRAPGNGKRLCRTCIGSQDMLPTVLGLLGVPIPAEIEGEDCSPYILTESEDLERVSFLCACPGRAQVVAEFARCGKNPMAYGWRGVRTQDYTYIIELGYEVTPRPARYLYCTAADPQQLHPLDLSVPENRRTAQRLEKQTLGWMQQQKDAFAGLWCKEAQPL